MLRQCLVGFFASVALAASAAPCDGRLCASLLANTSLQAATAQAASLPPPAFAAAPAPADVPPPAVHPKAVPIRLGLLLPLRSDTLGPPAEAVLAGFMAAFERDRDGFAVNVIESGETPQQAQDAYTAAIAANDIVVGPLTRAAVGAVAASPAATKPTIALNNPDSKTALPPHMLVIAFSIEDEARQAANWAHAAHPAAKILLVTGASAWQRRIAGAFAAQARQLGHALTQVELPASNGYLSESAIQQLKLKTDAEPPGLLFAALDADQLRQIRTMLGSEAPFYSTSSANPGTAPGQAMTELDGLHLLDLPWLVQLDHPSVMVYPRRTGGGAHQLDLDRLYALGIDAFRVAREIANKPEAAFLLDGVTGKLAISFGQGPSRFERQHPAVVYQGGAYKAATAGR